LWVLSEEQVLEMANKEASLLALINEFYVNLSEFATETIEPTMDELNGFAYLASYEKEYGKAIEILDYAIAKWPKDPNLLDSKAEMLGNQGNYVESKKMYQEALILLESDTTYYDSENYAYYKELMTKSIKKLSPNFIKYKGLITDGTQLLEEKKYKKASSLFTEAFKLGFKKGTHRERVNSVEAFAQTGEFDKAFEQLDLLANYFKWRGSDFFKNRELMNPLHKDKRWDKLMTIFDGNE
jgi:tetratricopeptide (TPR) repeat protein